MTDEWTIDHLKDVTTEVVHWRADEWYLIYRGTAVVPPNPRDWSPEVTKPTGWVRLLSQKHPLLHFRFTCQLRGRWLGCPGCIWTYSFVDGHGLNAPCCPLIEQKNKRSRLDATAS